MTFEDFLKQQHIKENPQVLDDDLAEDFEKWLAEKDGNDIMAYAEEATKQACRADCGYCNGEDKV